MAEDLKRHAYEYFRMKGYADHQAAALAAHMDQESGGNTRAIHDQGTGLGIYGWRDPTPGSGRKTDLINFASANGQDPHALNTQLDFANHELNTSEKAAGDRLRGSTDYQGAVNAGMAYLRPAGYTADNPQAGHNYVGRYNAGAELAGVQPISAPPGSNYSPGGGLLAAPTGPPATVQPWDSPDIDTRTASSDAEINDWGHSNDAAAEKANAKMAAAGAASTQAGMSLLSSAETPGVKQNLQAEVYRPQGDAQAQGNPNFVQQLAQLQLQRKKPFGGY